MAAYALFRYVTATGGFDLSELSAKRSAFVGGNTTYQGGQGQWRALNELASIAFWLVIAKNAIDHRGNRPGRLLLTGLLFLNAIALPIYSSTRAQVIYVILTALVVHVCLSPRIRLRTAIRVGLVALTLLSMMTFLRQQSEGGQGKYNPVTAVRLISDAVILNLNFMEVPKAVNIIGSVPDQLPYSHGSTIYNYAVAPVPRSFWPEKPIIDSGVEVGLRVYSTDGSAIPPGAIAEFYWAYGAGTLVVLSFLLGFGLRRLFEATRGLAGASVGGALMFASAVFDIGGNAVSGSVGYALSSALLAAGTMWLVLRFAGGKGATETLSHPSQSVRLRLPDEERFARATGRRRRVRRGIATPSGRTRRSSIHARNAPWLIPLRTRP